MQLPYYATSIPAVDGLGLRAWILSPEKGKLVGIIAEIATPSKEQHLTQRP